MQWFSEEKEWKFMNMRSLRSWKLAIILMGLALAGAKFDGSGFVALAQDAPPAPTDNPVLAPPIPDSPSPSQDVDPAAPAPRLSPGAAEVAKLARAGLGEDVMLAYIGNVNGTFNLGSDQIVFLNDLGVSSTVVKAMIQSDDQYRAAAQAYAAGNQQAPSAPPAPPPVPSDDGAYPTPPDNPSMSTDPGDMPDYSTPDDYGANDDTDYFYNSLTPYGSWAYVSGAGLCWQPTVCLRNRSWRPYCDRGRWVFSDCGWYWKSDYSWGGAAFHYGRWFNDRGRGWVWKPDHVWGPAWVSWRQSHEYCGWAPLPPSAHFAGGTGLTFHGHAVPANFDFGLRASQYTFIPIARMTDYSPYRYAATSSQARELFTKTAPINHVSVENNHVVAHGIDPQQVASASGIEVRRAEIRESAVAQNNGALTEHMTKQGNSLMIFRPHLSMPVGTSRPRQISVPPAVNPKGFKSSMNGSSVTMPTIQARTTPRYPAGSLVLSGHTSGNTSRQSSEGLPNLNFSHRASQTITPNYYASVPPQETSEARRYFNQNDQVTRPVMPAQQTVSGYRSEYVAGQSSVSIPSHFTVGSRIEGHPAYSVYGGGSAQPQSTSQYRSYETPASAGSGGHFNRGESYTGSRSESSAPAYTSHSSGSTPSHSTSTPSSQSSSPSEHR